MPVSSIIDIGTNTIHLLVANYDSNGYTYLLREKFPARLGEGGSSSNYITPEAIERGLYTLKRFKALSLEHGSTEILAFATAMVRNANNGQEFATQVKKETGIDIQIISGDQEAAYIFRGISSSVPRGIDDFLVMDIGGGSTEFILSSKRVVDWKQSFQFGVTSLLEKFILTDPISTNELTSLKGFIDKQLIPLWSRAPKNITLIGASGSFDSFSEMIFREKSKNPFIESENFEFSSTRFRELHNKIIHSSSEQRAHYKGLVNYRINTIVPSAVLLDAVLSKLEITRIIRSPFALKEGAFLTHYIDQN